jgi:hypothetical protein
VVYRELFNSNDGSIKVSRLKDGAGYEGAASCISRQQASPSKEEPDARYVSEACQKRRLCWPKTVQRCAVPKEVVIVLSGKGACQD